MKIEFTQIAGEKKTARPGGFSNCKQLVKHL
jgi:hypothetical protein